MDSTRIIGSHCIQTGRRLAPLCNKRCARCKSDNVSMSWTMPASSSDSAITFSRRSESLTISFAPWSPARVSSKGRYARAKATGCPRRWRYCGTTIGFCFNPSATRHSESGRISGKSAGRISHPAACDVAFIPREIDSPIPPVPPSGLTRCQSKPDAFTAWITCQITGCPLSSVSSLCVVAPEARNRSPRPAARIMMTGEGIMLQPHRLCRRDGPPPLPLKWKVPASARRALLEIVLSAP
ncbi:hypothetical protein Sant_3136 [Sodalis praecaptivus]|uniref:Uncharacterized protein n=1 Tax=Sodalis praecaptivus TaxID=1239307 RepID=W0I0Z0_9GAMM|nr:hypothetical protein Sant_3136 [Sodalis praecaptivus]